MPHVTDSLSALPRLLTIIALTLTVPLTVSGTTYYIAPDGSDTNAGTTENQPLASFDAAVAKLAPGDTLIVLDGIYRQDGEAGGLLLEDKHGKKGKPIVIKAQNERRAWLQGNGLVSPIKLRNSSWIVIDGLRASSRDNPEGTDADGSVAGAERSHHIVFRRLLTHNPNRYENATVIGASLSHHVLVEECEAYSFHRHGISFHRGDHNVIRRSFVNARKAPTPQGSGMYLGHGCCRMAGDEGFSFYFTSNSILENSVSMHTEQLSIIGGVATVLNNPGGQNNKVLGNISYKDLRPGGFMQSRRFIHKASDRYGGFTGPVKNTLYRDYLLIGGQTLDRGGGFSWHVAQDARLDNSTFINFEKQPPIGLNAGGRGNPDDPDENSLFLGCERPEVSGCQYRISNALFLNNAYDPATDALLKIDPPSTGQQVIVSHANAWSDTFPERGFAVDEDISDGVGFYRHSNSMKPTHVGLEQGECAVYIPEESNMAHKGMDTDGDGQQDDIGANVLYRYVNGKLTDQPLWNPETGEFPHGAVIEGSPNDPEEHEVVAANIHEHLNVNTNGCTLPYSR